MQLKLTKSEPTGLGISSTAQPKAEKWWVKHAISLVVALLGTGTVLWAVAQAVLTDYDLVITEPAQEKIIVNSEEVALNWYLWPKNAFLRGRDDRAAASVIVWRRHETVSVSEEVAPPFVVQLQGGEGDYVVEVRPEKKAKPERIFVTYKRE